ncbi:unnamed protein product [Macrosiphum euphorbiae]|uniref:LAGLIDADG homing endonuclease n=1 Tax=Macrosiphum euphorbiae TaxID=13131 RepID=A0AAV0XWD6_9HEMI|nr:unnamed protein product [Macrosiphum euphorbiae]
MTIDYVESTEFASSSAKNVKPKIRIIDPFEIMDPDTYIRWMIICFSDIITKPQTNGLTKLAVVKPSTSGRKPSLPRIKVNGFKRHLNDKNHFRGNLIEIEKLYKRYFSKSVQGTLVTIANILNAI